MRSIVLAAYCKIWAFHAVETITTFAADNGVDLLVMGSRGLGGFERLLLGSVSDHVLHHAHYSVLVVR